MTTPLILNANVKPACLPDEGQTAKKGFVSGWGSIRRSANPDKGNLLTLSFFSAELITNEECPFFIYNNTYCAKSYGTGDY